MEGILRGQHKLVLCLQKRGFSARRLGQRRQNLVMASQGYKDYETRHRNPNPSQTALLVIDMQEYFRDIAAPIFPAIQQTIAVCRAAGIPVIYTRHSHNGPSDHGMLGEWWPGLIHDGTPEAELLPEVKRTDKDKLVHKHVYSAFHGTDIESFLRENGKTEVIVTGVMTNLCCETTARDAFVRGFRVFFSTDATATLLIVRQNSGSGGRLVDILIL